MEICLFLIIQLISLLHNYRFKDFGHGTLAFFIVFLSYFIVDFSAKKAKITIKKIVVFRKLVNIFVV